MGCAGSMACGDPGDPAGCGDPVGFGDRMFGGDLTGCGDSMGSHGRRPPVGGVGHPGAAAATYNPRRQTIAPRSVNSPCAPGRGQPLCFILSNSGTEQLGCFRLPGRRTHSSWVSSMRGLLFCPMPPRPSGSSVPSPSRIAPGCTVLFGFHAGNNTCLYVWGWCFRGIFAAGGRFIPCCTAAPWSNRCRGMSAGRGSFFMFDLASGGYCLLSGVRLRRPHMRRRRSHEPQSSFRRPKSRKSFLEMLVSWVFVLLCVFRFRLDELKDGASSASCTPQMHPACHRRIIRGACMRFFIPPFASLSSFSGTIGRSSATPRIA